MSNANFGGFDNNAAFTNNTNNTNKQVLKVRGVSQVAVLYVLVKQCLKLGAYKLCREVLATLQTLKLPPKWRDSIELDCLLIRTKSFADPESISIICPKCSSIHSTNLVCYREICSQCNHPFMRCMLTFATLPLVEFKVSQNNADNSLLTHDKAIELVNSEPIGKSKYEKQGVAVFDAMQKSSQNINETKHESDEHEVNDESQDETANNRLDLDGSDNFDQTNQFGNDSDANSSAGGNEENDSFYRQLLSLSSGNKSFS